MKTSIWLLSLALVSPVAAQTTPSASPTAPSASPAAPSSPMFNWKLRLAKGQTWTQTITTKGFTRQTVPDPRSKSQARMEINISSTVALKSQVLDVTPAFFLVRATYIQSNQKVAVQLNGKPAPQPASSFPDVSKALIGASFSIKQAPDGRVLDVTGLEDLVARQQKALNATFKTPQERAAFARLMPSMANLSKSIRKQQSMNLPPTPLAVGQSYSYAISLPSAFAFPLAVQGKRTLVSFDTGSATFDENATFSVAPFEFIGSKANTVLLTGNAARYYYLNRTKAQVAKRYGQPVQFYLSRNGHTYYRDPRTHQAIFVVEPAPGYSVRVPSEPPAVLPRQPKGFLTMNGTISGQSVIDAQTGLARTSSVTTKISGKVTVVEPNGHKTSVPIDATTQTTVTTQ